MPREGHKEGCKCAVCKVLDKKLAAVVATEPTGPTLGSVPIGQNFRLNGQVYKKINHGLVLNYLNGDDATEPMDSSTVIDPILPGHAVEPDA